MKKINYALLSVIAVFLFVISYALDEKTNFLFKNLKYPLLDMPLSVITNFAVVVLVMLLLPSAILYKKNRNAVYLLWAAFILSVFLAFAIKLAVMRQRPMGLYYYPFTNMANYSFPSMHSMAAFALLPALIRYMPKQKIFWIVFAFLAAFSRIYFGFHFLSDAVFGAVAGYMAGHILLRYMDFTRKV